MLPIGLVALGAVSAAGLALSDAFHPAAPKPKVTTHVVFTAISSPALPGRPPCYPHPGLNVATGTADAHASYSWEMFASATPAQVAAQRDCLHATAGLEEVSERVVTAPPGGWR